MAIGGVCEKEQVVETIFYVASKMGEEVEGPYVDHLFGGHRLRTIGAFWLASFGIELAVNQLQGRRNSNLVECYVSETPFIALPTILKESLEALDEDRTNDSASIQLDEEIVLSKGDLAFNVLAHEMQAFKVACQRLIEKVEEMEAVATVAKIVYGVKSKGWHRI